MDERIEKKRWPLTRILFLLVILVGLGFLATYFYKNIGISKLNVQSERLLTDTIHSGIFKEYISIFGNVEPLKTVFLDAVESGKIEEIFVEDGAMVAKGAPLLRLSNLDLQLEVLNQEAMIVDQINTIQYQKIVQEQQRLNLREQALDVEFQIDLIGKQAARNKSLWADSVIAQVEFQESQDEYEHLLRRRKLLKATIEKDSLSQVLQEDQMRNSLDLMRRNLEFAKSSLGNLIVQAPIDGQISSFDSEVGELIQQGSRIAQIDVLHNFKIRARIDEFYISRVYPNQEGTLSLDGKNYLLNIKKIYPEVQNQSFEVDLIFVGDRPPNIKRGQSVSIRLTLSDETQATLLAKGGFFQSTGGNWVYAIDADGNARKRDIQLGRQNPDFFEVTQGLIEGDIVIISSYQNYGDKDALILK